MTTIQYNTPAEYRAASVLSLCYYDDQILPLCGRPLLDALLSIPGADACWFLAGSLPVAQRVEWAAACARRAKEYARARADAADAADAAAAAYAAYAADAAAAAYAADAAYAAADAAYAAADAADAAAAAYAAAYAAYAAAARKAEYQISVRHGVLLLELR